MSNDIVKQILLRFRGDAKPLEKDLAEVKKTVASLDKAFGGGPGGSRGGGMAGMSKAIEQYSKVTQKFGMSMDKDLTKFGKHIRDIAMKDVGLLKKQTEDLFRKSSDNLKKVQDAERRYEDLKRTGGSSKQYRQAHNKLLRRQSEAASASGAFQESADELAERGALIQDQRGRSLSAGLGAIAAVAGTGAMIFGGYKQGERTQVNAQAQLGQMMLERRRAQYSGDATEFLMEARDKSVSKSRAYAQGQTGWADAGERALGFLAKVAGGAGSGALLGGAAGLVGGPLAGVTAAGGAIVGGVAGAVKGSVDLYDYYLKGGREAAYGQAYNQSLDKERKTNMTATYYQNLREHAPGRYEFQRQMRMGDPELMGMINTGAANLFSEDQAAGTTMAFRSQFGNKASKGMFGLAAQAMEMARSQGMSLENAQGMVGAVGYSGKGGTTDSKRVLTEMYTNAFAKGLTDSGLIEVLNKGIVGIAAQSPDVMDIASLGSRIAASLEGGKDLTARDVAGAQNAYQRIQDMSMGGGEMGILKQSKLAVATGGNVAALSLLEGRTDAQIYDMAKNMDPRLVGTMGEAATKQLAQSYSPEQTLQTALTKTTFGRKAQDVFRDAINGGKNYEEAIALASGYVETMTGGGNQSAEQAKAETRTAFGNLSPEELGIDPTVLQAAKNKVKQMTQAPSAAGKTGAEAIQKGAIQGQAALSQEAMLNMSPEQIQAAQNALQNTAAPVGGDISSSAQSLKSALDAFVSAVTNQTGTSASAQSAGSADGG